MALAMIRIFFVISIAIKLVLLKSYYEVRVEKVEIPYYNLDYIGDPTFIFFDLNGTPAYNISSHVKQDLGLDEYGNLTVYKFAKGQYRMLPTNFHENPCTVLKNNMFGSRDYFQTANISKCPIRRGFYRVNNFVIGLDKIPPHLLPYGKYKICGNLYVSRTLIGSACGQGEVKQPSN